MTMELQDALTEHLVRRQLNMYAEALLWLEHMGGYGVCAELNPSAARDGSLLWYLVEMGYVDGERKIDGDLRGGFDYFRYTLTEKGKRLAERIRRERGLGEHPAFLNGVDVSSVFPEQPVNYKPRH